MGRLRRDAAGFERVRELLAQPLTGVTELTIDFTRAAIGIGHGLDVLIEDLDLLDQPVEELSTDTLLHHHHVLHSSFNGAPETEVYRDWPAAAERSERPSANSAQMAAWGPL